jgi:hypothetical protein
MQEPNTSPGASTRRGGEGAQRDGFTACDRPPTARRERASATREHQLLADFHCAVVEAVQAADLRDHRPAIGVRRVSLGDVPQCVARLDHDRCTRTCRRRRLGHRLGSCGDPDQNQQCGQDEHRTRDNAPAAGEPERRVLLSTRRQSANGGASRTCLGQRPAATRRGRPVATRRGRSVATTVGQPSPATDAAGYPRRVALAGHHVELSERRWRRRPPTRRLRRRWPGRRSNALPEGACRLRDTHQRRRLDRGNGSRPALCEHPPRPPAANGRPDAELDWAVNAIDAHEYLL